MMVSLLSHMALVKVLTVLIAHRASTAVKIHQQLVLSVKPAKFAQPSQLIKTLWQIWATLPKQDSLKRSNALKASTRTKKEWASVKTARLARLAQFSACLQVLIALPLIPTMELAMTSLGTTAAKKESSGPSSVNMGNIPMLAQVVYAQTAQSVSIVMSIWQS